MIKPTISVVIHVYNVVDNIRRSLDQYSVNSYVID